MTRKEIEADYKVVDGVIRSPGRFEGEPVWVVALWERFLNGEDGEEVEDPEDGQPCVLFDMGELDSHWFREFPETDGLCNFVVLWARDDGFVCHAEHDARPKGV